MISLILTGAASAIIGMAAGQGLVMSLGRRRLASQLGVMVERQTNLYNRVNTLEAVRGESDAAEQELAARLARLEEALPSLISRSEVERAFAQAAQIEAQRQVALQQQARTAATFKTAAPAPDLNTAINGQLQALEERIQRINQEFGLG